MTITNGQAEFIGGCNNCHCREGTIREVSLATITFRLCEACAVDLH